MCLGIILFYTQVYSLLNKKRVQKSTNRPLADKIFQEGMAWNLFLSGPSVKSLISITLRTCGHTNMISQTIIDLILTLKKSNYGPKNLTIIQSYRTLQREIGRRI